MSYHSCVKSTTADLSLGLSGFCRTKGPLEAPTPTWPQNQGGQRSTGR